MSLIRLSLHQFRNIRTCTIQLATGFNFFIGPNGSGKTNLIEAVYFLGLGRSFKPDLINQVIHNEYNELFIHGVYVNSSKLELPIGINKKHNGTKIVKIKGKSGQKISQLAKILPLQLIHPESVELLLGAPKFRRAFIDWGLFYTKPEFYNVWGRFKRLIKQRNALLKKVSNYQSLIPWDRELIILAESINTWRGQYVKSIQFMLQDILSILLPEVNIEFEYYSGWNKDFLYQSILEKNFVREKTLGYTLCGPNKADFKSYIDGVPVDRILSRGQLKLMVCALRVAQGQHLKKTTTNQCIYLIDDFASELDNNSQNRLSNCLSTIDSQIFISLINERDISKRYNKNGKVFHVKHGVITERKRKN
ncbi:DNA replication and repair protein recF [Candidatus Photodesmus katoptron]|uniref:DNA replication and repair protein RecF n=1 Tax=Candidatus Photodesmus katoptron Akat1 TaxID=1236703 RepID=S3DGI3_9GAMM|nr:DNA replication/repair protein RecF [Candidatus Photodesmus katoptron]EPE37562.1 DNA replication and repair protein RecF [Candidatus Photodesmus katoptron Akat1]KEY90729.1 DNA replication and repair protein recF [Candidatus Photodesmus katoptron]